MMNTEHAAADFQDSLSLTFVAGLCAGVAIGAGLGLLFAPRSGAELRGQMADSASDVGKAVSRTIDGVAAAGRGAYGQAREVISTAGDTLDRLSGEAARIAEQGLAAARAMAPGRVRRPNGMSEV
jgi:gas vesicle protein